MRFVLSSCLPFNFTKLCWRVVFPNVIGSQRILKFLGHILSFPKHYAWAFHSMNSSLLKNFFDSTIPDKVFVIQLPGRVGNITITSNLINPNSDYVSELRTFSIAINSALRVFLATLHHTASVSNIPQSLSLKIYLHSLEEVLNSRI